MNLATTPDRPFGDERFAFGAFAVALAILALPAHSAGTLALIVLGAAVTWFAPAVMIAMVIITVPIQDHLVLPFAGGNLTVTQIALFGLVIGGGLGIWRHLVWLDGIIWWYVAILGSFVLSFVATDEFGTWAGEVYRWGAAALFYLIARSVLRDWATIRIALAGMVVAVCGLSAYGFGQVLASNGPSSFIRGGVLRVYGAFGQPNPLAAYMEFTVPILLALALLGLRRNVRQHIGTALWLGMAVASAMGAAIVALTQSRGGWVGFAAAMIVLFWVFPVRLRLGAVGAGVVLFGLVLLTPPGQSQLERFQTSFSSDEGPLMALIDAASTGRESLWGAAIGMVADEPLTGVGAGEFDFHYRQYTPEWHDRLPLGQAHNGYLHMAAQAGLVGVATFVGWILAMLVSLIGAFRRSTSPVPRGLALGALASVTAFTMHSVVDYLNVLSLGLQLSATVAIGLNLIPQPLTLGEPRSQRLTLTPTPLQTGNA
jgi:O-antigen ligase